MQYSYMASPSTIDCILQFYHQTTHTFVINSISLKMNSQSLQENLDDALAMYEAGSTYAQIRHHFSASMDEETISYLIRLVDEFVLEEDRLKGEIRKAGFRKKLGILALALSVFLLYGLHTYSILDEIKRQWIYSTMLLLQYLPVMLSAYYLWTAYREEARLRKKTVEIDDSKFRLKRGGR
jgi:hypothetical protein